MFSTRRPVMLMFMCGFILIPLLAILVALSRVLFPRSLVLV